MKNKTFKLVGSKFLFIMLLGLLGLMIFIHIMLIKEDQNIIKEMKFFLFGFYLFLAIALIYAYNNVTKRVIITNDKIRYTSLFKKKEIALNTIKKFSVKKFTIDLTSKDDTNFKLFKNSHLLKWLAANFEDFNAIAYQEEVDEILQDERFGATKEERETNLGKADFYGNLLNVTSGLYLVLIAFIPVPLKITMYVSFFLTVAIIVGIIYYRGKLRLESSTAFPSLYSASFFTIILNTTTLMYTGDLGEISFLKPSVIITLILTIFYILAVVGLKKFKLKYSWFPLVFFFGLTITGATVLNCVADASKPVLFSTQIQEKIIEPGRYTTYKIELAPWEKTNIKHIRVEISRHIYKKLENGETVQIKQYKGFLHNKWFMVNKEDKELNGNKTVFGW